MVLPDGVGSSSRQRLSPPRLAVVIAILAVSTGMWGLASLTEPEDTPDAEAIASPSAPVAEGLHWQKMVTLPRADVYALAQLGDDVVVFTSSSQWTSPELTGLHLWHSNDGLMWQQGNSVVASGSRIQSVTSTALGIVALGFGPKDDSLHAWLSVDGNFWLPLAEGLPLDIDSLTFDGEKHTTTEATLVGDDILSLIGDDASVLDMAFKNERGIALITRTADRARPYDIARFEIWAAPISS